MQKTISSTIPAKSHPSSCFPATPAAIEWNLCCTSLPLSIALDHATENIHPCLWAMQAKSYFFLLPNGFKTAEEALTKPGKHKTCVGCLYIQHPENIGVKVLEKNDCHVS